MLKIIAIAAIGIVGAVLAKIMHMFFDMDSMVGKDFEPGLANLKAITEK